MLKELLSNDTFVGVVIGGLLGLVPTIIGIFVEGRRQSKQQKHEIKLKKIELIYTSKIQTLLEYCRQAGSMIGNTPGIDCDRGTFMAAHERAVLYVSEDTKNAMKEAIPIILDGTISPGEKVKQRQISVLDRKINEEMNLPIE